MLVDDFLEPEDEGYKYIDKNEAGEEGNKGELRNMAPLWRGKALSKCTDH